MGNAMNSRQPKSPADTYEHYFVPAMFLPWSSILLSHAALQARERVLDVACGTGIVARQVAPLVGTEGQVAALDMNPAMLAVARSIPVTPGTTIRWQEGNAMALPFPEGAFDVVLCLHGLQFFPDRAGQGDFRRLPGILDTNGTLGWPYLPRNNLFTDFMGSQSVRG